MLSDRDLFVQMAYCNQSIGYASQSLNMFKTSYNFPIGSKLALGRIQVGAKPWGFF